MSNESPFSNADQAIAEFTSEQKEQLRKERDQVLEENRESFILECVEQADELSDEQIVFVSQYLRTHSGVWQSYSGTDVYVSTAEIINGKWVVEFCVTGEDPELPDDHHIVTAEIPLS